MQHLFAFAINYIHINMYVTLFGNFITSYISTDDCTVQTSDNFNATSI